MPIFILLCLIFIYGGNLVGQERDAFQEHILRKEREAQERLRNEKKLNLNLFNSLRKGLRSDDPHIRLKSLKSIMLMKEVPNKEYLIKDYLDDKVPEIRIAILEYYGEKLRAEDAETMLWVVEDKNLRVRLKLVDVLLKFQQEGVPVYDLMSLLFEDKQLVVRQRLLEGLLNLPEHLIQPNKTFTLVSGIIYNDMLNLRLMALKLVEPFPLQITHDTLEATLRDSQLPVRQLSLEIIGKTVNEKSKKLIAERLSDPATSMRRGAIDFLADRLDEDILRIFENHLLNERNNDLRIKILGAVAQDRSPLAVSIITSYISDPITEVRRFAAELLSQMQQTIDLDLYGRR